MSYKLVGQVRIQEGVVEKEYSWWKNMEEDIPEKLLNRNVPGEFYLYEEDDLCFLEHRINGMLTANTQRPLTPYSILAGRRMIEEVSRNRRTKKVYMGREAVFAPKNNFEGVLGRKSGGRSLLNIGEGVRKEFFEWVHSVKEQWGIRFKREDDLLETYCEFDSPGFDKRTERIILPKLIKVNYLPVPKKFSAKIQLKEVLIWENERDGYQSIIDSEGWRIDLI